MSRPTAPRPVALIPFDRARDEVEFEAFAARLGEDGHVLVEELAEHEVSVVEVDGVDLVATPLP